MAMLKTKHFKIVINTNVGNINQKKADSLANAFNNGFEVKMLQEQPFGNVFILANPINREALIIDPSKITYQMDSEDTIVPDFEKIKENLKVIFDTLLLDENTTGLIHYVGQVESKDENSMTNSLRKFLPHQDLANDFKNLKGLGLRFLFEHHTGLWEYKVEPHINDVRYFFVEMICNVNTGLHINDITKIANEYYNDFTDSKINVLEILGIS